MMNKVINPYEYKMPETFARNLLSKRKGEEKNLKPQEYLCAYVNEQYGIKGTCVRVVLY